jgi:hypothetical protein
MVQLVLPLLPLLFLITFISFTAFVLPVVGYTVKLILFIAPVIYFFMPLIEQIIVAGENLIKLKVKKFKILLLF